MLEWIINLLVEVHRCPAVPTAPNTAPGTTILRSALGVMIMALFPPSSNKDLPNLAPTASPTDLPILVEPVADTNGTLLSFDMSFPISAPPITKPETPSGTLFASNTSFVIC